jgi:hypothetical protein
MGCCKSAQGSRGSQNLGLRIRQFSFGIKVALENSHGKERMWKSTIVKKYGLGTRKRSMDSSPPGIPGSPIWKLLRSTIPFFQKDLHWIPGNGKSINLWKDKILNQNPLEQKEHYIELRGWLGTHLEIDPFLYF